MAEILESFLEKGTDGRGRIVCDVNDVKDVKIDVDSEFSHSSIIQESVLDFGDEGFVLKNVLTERECAAIIETAESTGFEQIQMQESYRNSQRIVLNNLTLAGVLWRRISPFLKEITIDGDPTSQHIHGVPFALKGTWIPSHLNPLFRLCRYEPGGHFAPHFDGHFAIDTNERSLKTFMLYLNSDFDGGCTNFIDENQKLHKDEDGRYCAQKENILCQVLPEPGMAIIFNHHRLHEGEQVRNNRKYILRTDIMFKKNEKKMNESQTKAILYLQEAERYEANGDQMKAVEFYKKAYKLCPELEHY